MNSISFSEAVNGHKKKLDVCNLFCKGFASWLVKHEIGNANLSYFVFYGQKIEVSLSPVYMGRLLGKLELYLLAPTEIAEQMKRVYLISIYMSHEQCYGILNNESNDSNIFYIKSTNKTEMESYIYKPIIKKFFQHYNVETF